MKVGISMKNLLEINNLRKNYGSKEALQGLSLTLEEGKVYGLLGPNGSGKTTLIKVLAGLLPNYKGEVLINGLKPGVETKAIVSYLPDRNFLPSHSKIKDIITMYDDFFEDFDPVKADCLLRSMGLKDDMKVNSLSKGMTEKLNLSMILSRDAKLFILDEPIAGVDPIARDQILDAIIDNVGKESTMLITTHLVKDIERVFDKVGFIDNGRIVLEDDAETLRTVRNNSIDGIYKEVFADGEY